MVQRISEVEGEPEVGRYYMVPCVLHYNEWVPVIGPAHDDKEYIGIGERHYHRDLRFLGERVVDEEYCERVTFRGPVSCQPEELAMITIPYVDRVQAGPIEKRRKCKRRMPDFPLAIHKRKASWFRPLERAYADAKACARCPHKGMPLKGLPAKDGVVICPGHGLAWSVETGELVRRV